jgi:hypothetical protein
MAHRTESRSTTGQARLHKSMPKFRGSLLTSISFLVSLFTTPALAEPRGERLPALNPSSLRLNAPDSDVRLRARGEIGSLGVLSHRIQYGLDRTRVDYREDADQDTLFLFTRLSAELELLGHHTLVFLYQPLAFETESVLGRDLEVGAVEFEAETPVRFGYGFDFYRLAYQYDFVESDRAELAIGAGFQIRNARISFAATDGTQAFTQTNLGVVPLLRVRGRYLFDNALFLELEVDGWVSPVPSEGPDGEPALGAIADASLRAGFLVTQWSEAFVGLRYLGGGFRGVSSEPTPLDGGDRWSSNWLHTMTVTLGLGVR